MSDIKPCPFCGSGHARIERDVSDGVSFYVFCNGCASQGPCSLASEDDALVRWNVGAKALADAKEENTRLRGLLRDMRRPIR